MSATALVRAPGRAARAGCHALLLAVAGVAGAAPRSAPGTASPDPTLVRQLTPLRSAFLKRIDEEGYRLCETPSIEPGEPPAFGHYITERNTVQIAAGPHLPVEQREAFDTRARQSGGTKTARSIFDESLLRWVFVRELGHWWQSCRQQTRAASFGEANGANRIALAFWREHDPHFAAGLVEDARALLRVLPSPLPPGAPLQVYFDANFRTIAVDGTHEWFQARMIADLANEVPQPSFHKALSQPLYPW